MIRKVYYHGCRERHQLRKAPEKGQESMVAAQDLLERRTGDMVAQQRLRMAARVMTPTEEVLSIAEGCGMEFSRMQVSFTHENTCTDTMVHWNRDAPSTCGE